MIRIVTVLLIQILLVSCTKESKPLYQWSFNTNKLKSTIEKNTKTVYKIHSNFETPEFVNGVEGSGLRFDGYSTAVTGNLPQPLNTPSTISAWVALETYPNDIASFFSLTLENSKENWISAGLNQFGKAVITVFIKGNEKHYFSKQIFPKFKWFNVSMTINEDKLQLFMNGVNCLNVLVSDLNSQTRFKELTIGANPKEKYLDNVYPLTHINGIIDEVKIWNTSLEANYFKDFEIADRTNEKVVLAIPKSRFRKDFNRPKYHLLPAANWTNETHGLVYYKGKYHIFNQKNGANVFLGQINWGHFSSPDLVQWTEHKPALSPEEAYDQIGIWSGHVVKDDQGIPLIVYTGGNEKVNGMCLAFPEDDNLINWKKFKGNPVVKGPPKQYSRTDLRDPYIWKEKQYWYMTVGYGIVENGVQKGALLLYKSTDLKKWTYLHLLFKGNPKVDDSGIFWEMPVFWKMKDKYVLAVNPTPHDGKPAINLYWTGDFVNEKFVPDTKLPKKLEVINRLLSPSVAFDKDGNTTAIAIIPDLIPSELHLQHGWAHLYSIPRIWKLKNGEIYQTPHPALIKLRDSLKTFEKVSVNESANFIIGRGHQVEIIAEILPKQSSKFGFYIGKNQKNGEATKLCFDLKKNQLVIDQYKSSQTELVPKRIETGEMNLKNSKRIKIHLFIDGSVIEGFINDKEAFTTRIFPKCFNSNEVEFFSENESIVINKLNFWHLKASNNLTDF